MDKKSGMSPDDVRVRKTDIGKDGVPYYINGKGYRRRVYHPDEMMPMMTSAELANWAMVPLDENERARRSQLTPGSMEVTEEEAKQIAGQI